MPLRLAALIVTHNRLDRLQETLARTLAEGPDRVLVVDNASEDGTAAWLGHQDDPRLEVLRLSENGGGAGGFAAGLAHLRDPAGRPPDAADVAAGATADITADTAADITAAGADADTADTAADTTAGADATATEAATTADITATEAAANTDTDTGADTGADIDPDTVPGDRPAPPDWIVLYDDDAWPGAGAFDRLRRAAAGAAADLGVVAAAVHHPDGRISEMNRPGRNPFWHPRAFVSAVTGGRRGFHVADADLAPHAPPREIDIASFVGYALRTRALDRVAPPEAGLFLYGDDVLFSLRLRRAGWRIALEPGIRFVHDCATMQAGYTYRPVWKIYYHCRNGVQIAREAAGRPLFPAALGWYLVVWSRRARTCPPGTRPLYRRLMWRGVADGLRGKRGRVDEVHRLADRLAEGAG